MIVGGRSPLFLGHRCLPNSAKYVPVYRDGHRSIELNPATSNMRSGCRCQTHNGDACRLFQSGEFMVLRARVGEIEHQSL